MKTINAVEQQAADILAGLLEGGTTRAQAGDALWRAGLPPRLARVLFERWQDRVLKYTFTSDEDPRLRPGSTRTVYFWRSPDA